MDTFYYNNEYGTAATSTNNGLVEKYNDNYFSYNTQQMLNWNKTIKENHNFDVLIGHEFGKTDQRVVDAYKKNIFYPGIPELGNAVSQYSNGSTSSTVVTAIEGYFARVNYNSPASISSRVRTATTDRRASSTTSGATSGLWAPHGVSRARASWTTLRGSTN